MELENDEEFDFTLEPDDYENDLENTSSCQVLKYPTNKLYSLLEESKENEKGQDYYSSAFTTLFIPRDILFSIFCFLEAQDLCICAQVCRMWKKISEEDILWKDLVDKRGGNPKYRTTPYVDEILSCMKEKFFYLSNANTNHIKNFAYFFLKFKDNSCKNFQCFGCHKAPIDGPYYECMNCSNVVLCGDCEGEHNPYHILIERLVPEGKKVYHYHVPFVYLLPSTGIFREN